MQLKSYLLHEKKSYYTIWKPFFHKKNIQIVLSESGFQIVQFEGQKIFLKCANRKKPLGQTT